MLPLHNAIYANIFLTTLYRGPLHIRNYSFLDSSSFFFSLIVFHLMNQQHNGNKAMFTAHQANKIPKLSPILEWISKRIVLLASTTIFH